MTVNGKRPSPLNFDADHYVAKYRRKKLLWVYERDVGGWLAAGGTLVPIDPAEPANVRSGQDPTKSHVAHTEGTTLICVRRRTYDRIRLKPDRKRNKAIRRAIYGDREWWERWLRRIWVWIKYGPFKYARQRAYGWMGIVPKPPVIHVNWETLTPPPPAYFEDHADQLKATGFDFKEAEAKWKGQL